MDKSPLDKLSPEVRNLIYEYTFEGAAIDINLTGRAFLFIVIGTYARNNIDIGNTIPGLVHTCSKIREEARLLMFARSDVRVFFDMYAEDATRILRRCFGIRALKAVSAGKLNGYLATIEGRSCPFPIPLESFVAELCPWDKKPVAQEDEGGKTTVGRYVKRWESGRYRRTAGRRNP